MLLVSVSCAQAKETATAKNGDPETGRAIYEKYCFYCHGRTGRGDGAVAIAISPHPADFISDKKRMAKSDAELFKSISEGIQRDTGGEEMSMPRWKDILTEQERWDVLAYIRQLSKKQVEKENR
ncbi:MAG: cytochrome c [Deltaproteobacteria bacterium]|nr:cytochrome c [Deltaproteobacteria bacterium]